MEFDATFLIASISFIVFVFIMNKIFYAPILKIMKERENLVKQNYKSADDTRAETYKKTSFHDIELEKSRDEAREKISSASRRFKQDYSKEIAEYKKSLSDRISLEKDNLKNSALEAKEVLKDKMIDTAKEISDKLLGGSMQFLIDKSEIKEEQV